MEYLVDRLKKVKTIKKIIIATSKKKDDDKICALKFKNIYFVYYNKKKYLYILIEYKHIIKYSILSQIHL